jgi:hypothetical protein
MMLKELDETKEVGSAHQIEKIENEQKIYDMILHEIIRQVYVECADRGTLLERVSKR